MADQDLSKEDGELSDDFDAEFVVTDEIHGSDDQAELPEIKQTNQTSNSQANVPSTHSENRHANPSRKTAPYSSRRRNRSWQTSPRRRSRSPVQSSRYSSHSRSGPYGRKPSSRYRDYRESVQRSRYTDKKKDVPKSDAFRTSIQTVPTGSQRLTTSNQPPAPPPLPTAPPPHSPPAPPPLYAPPADGMRKFGRKVLHPQSSYQRNLPLSLPKPPSENIDEADYVDLLLEYKQIQKQLETITKEENSLHFTPESTEEKRDTAAEAGADDEEDLNELELRLAALASYARATRQDLEQDEQDADTAEQDVSFDSHVVSDVSIAVTEKKRPKRSRKRMRREGVKTSPTNENLIQLPLLGEEMCVGIHDNYDEVSMDIASSDTESSPVISAAERIPGILDGDSIESFSGNITGGLAFMDSNSQTAQQQVPESSNFNFNTTWKTSSDVIPGLDLGEAAAVKQASDDAEETVNDADTEENDEDEDVAASLREELLKSLHQSKSSVSTAAPPATEAVVNMEDDPAKMLRQKLLKDLSEKRVRETSNHETASQSAESPSISRVGSSSDLLTHLKPAKLSRQSPTHVDMPLPQHEPVIITMGDDSSDEENKQEQNQSSVVLANEGFLQGIDSFLRKAKEASQVTSCAGSDEQAATAPEESSQSATAAGESITRSDEQDANVSEKDVASSASQADDDVDDLVKRMKLQEETVNKQRRSLQKDEEKLLIYEQFIEKSSQQLQTTQQQVARLQAQLAAATKVYTDNKDKIDKASLSAKELRLRVGLKSRQLKTREDELSLLRKRIMDETPSAPRLVSLKDAMDLAITVSNSKGKTLKSAVDREKVKRLGTAKQPKVKPNPTKAILLPKTKSITAESKKEKSAKLTAEKERLLRLQLQLQKKIDLIKEGVKNKNTGKYASNSHINNAAAKENVANFAPEHIATQETMSLGSSLTDADQQNFSVVPTRRRSVVSEDSSTKPALLLKSQTSSHTQSKTTQNRTEASQDIVKTTSANDLNANSKVNGKLMVAKEKDGSAGLTGLKKECGFKMPSDKHKIKLRDHLRNNLMKISSEDHSKSSQTLLDRPFTCNRDLAHVPEGLAHMPVSKDVPDQSSAAGGSFKSYKSVLRQFRSYRMSVYYDRPNCVLPRSPSTSHMINPNQVFCPYDLTGICRDKKCPWQHQETYSMTSRDSLLDLAAYVTTGDNDKDVKTLERKTASELDIVMKKCYKLNINQKCTRLIRHIRQQNRLRCDKAVFLEPRSWRPQQRGSSSHDNTIIASTERDSTGSVKWKELVAAASVGNDEDIVLEEDVRYWMLHDDKSTTDMESSVLNDPSDVHMWLKLASKKLHDHRRSDNCLEHVLSVVSRGLESNRSSSELWIYYLRLYAMHPDCTKKELQEMYLKALHYAPSYTLHCKYLGVCETFSQKKEACRVIIEYLLSPSHSLAPSVLSHYMLETLLFSVQLCLLLARPKGALSVLQNALTGKGSKAQRMRDCFTDEDRVLAWLCYLHIMEFRCLPAHLHESTESNPSKLTNKKAVALSWPNMTTHLPEEQLNTELTQALELCAVGIEKSGKAALLMPLITSQVHLLCAHTQYDKAVQVCQSYLQKYPSLMDLWLLLTQVYTHLKDPESLVQTFDQAAQQDIYCAKLYLNLAQYQVQIGHVDWARETLMKYMCTMFYGDNPPDNAKPKLLYRVLLRQQIVMTSELTLPHPDTITHQLADIWLCYCELLVIDGDMFEAHRMYEEAVTSLHDTDELVCVWKSYLKFYYRHFVEPRSSAQVPHTVSGAFLELVERCLKTIPSRFTVDHLPSRLYTSFYNHNEILDLFFHCLEPSDKSEAYERCLKLMPSNINLIQRACEYWLREGEAHPVLGYCTTALLEFSNALPLHKLVLHSAERLASPPRQVRAFFSRAVEKFPFSLSLWKNFLLFELVHGTADRAKAVLDGAGRHEVPLQNYLASVLNEKAATPSAVVAATAVAKMPCTEAANTTKAKQSRQAAS